MRKTPRKPFLLLLAALLAASAQADDYDNARAALVAAYQAEDFPAMRAAADRSLVARPDYPGALFNRALAETLDGDYAAAFDTLGHLLAMGVDFGVADIDAFAPLRKQPAWQAYAEAVESLRTPVGDARVAYRYDDGSFVPEGIAIDDSGGLYLGGIRGGEIVRIEGQGDRLTSLRHADGGAQLFADSKTGPYWSVFGMQLRGDTLWLVSSGIPEFFGLQTEDEGANAIVGLDIDTGETKAITELGDNGNRQVLGDLIFYDDESVFVSDQTDGVVYHYDVVSGAFTPFVQRGTIRSPQGLVLDASREALYVADYVGGLFRVDLESGHAQRVEAPAGTSLYGIDGLYRYGNSLIAIQNGIQPNRVVRLDLSPDGRVVTEGHILAMNLVEFDEPNLGQVVGDEFFFIANSHWNRFDRDGNLPEGLEGPIVLAIRLD